MPPWTIDMQVFGFLLSQLLDLRAHIPGQPGFGSGPADGSHRGLHAVTALLIAASVLALVWLAVRLVLGFL